MADLLTRREHLAAAIQHMPLPIRAEHLAAASSAAGFGAARNTARKDARALVARGILAPVPGSGNRTYTRTETVITDTPRTACRCDEPGADPYACEAEPEDCSGEFSELNPHGVSARPVNETSAKVSRACPVCPWRTSVWHVDDGSAEAELHEHVTRRHDGNYEDGHYKTGITA